MASKTLKFNVDINIPNNISKGFVKVLDDVIFSIYVTENGVARDLSGQTCKMYCRRSDKTVVEQLTGISTNGNLITVKVKNSCFSSSGKAIFDIELEDVNGSVDTMDFIIDVILKGNSKEVLLATNEIDAISQIIKDIEEDYSNIKKVIIDENIVVNLQEQINILKALVESGADISQVLEELTQVKNSLTDSITSLDAKLTKSITDNYSSLNTKINNINGIIGTLQTSDTNINNKINALETEKDNIKNNIINLDNNKLDKTLNYNTLVTSDKSVLGAINEVFINASDGKKLIVDAITGKGVAISENDSFKTIADSINNIKTEFNDISMINNEVYQLEESTNDYTIAHHITLDKAVIVIDDNYFSIECSNAFYNVSQEIYINDVLVGAKVSSGQYLNFSCILKNTFEEGTTVEVSIKYKFAKVKTSYLIPIFSGGEDEEELDINGTVIVTGVNLNVRSKPTTTSTVLVTYAIGTSVKVVSILDGWYKIKLIDNSGYGYVSSTYVILDYYLDDNGWMQGRPSADGFRMTKGYEAFAPYKYQDAGSYWTIGYGITQLYQADLYNFLDSQPSSEEMASKCSFYLKIKSYGVPIVQRCIELGVTKQCQFDALVDMAFNCGVSTVTGTNDLTSAILKNINDEKAIREQWEKFRITSSGITLSGLILRRTAECDAFFGKGYEKRAIPKINSSGAISGSVTDNNGNGWLPKIYKAPVEDGGADDGGADDGYTKIEHIVASGETLYGIARQYGCSVADIQEWNNLTSTSLSVGQVLIIKIPKEDEPDPVITGTVKTDGVGLNLREATTTSSTILTKIPNGTIIEILESLDGWYKTQYDGHVGYVSSAYVSLNTSLVLS